MSDIFIVQFRCDNCSVDDHCTILGVYDSLELAKQKSLDFLNKNIDLKIKIQINKWILNESMKDQYEVWSVYNNTLYKQSIFQCDCFKN
jgi:hypothetical protein